MSISADETMNFLLTNLLSLDDLTEMLYENSNGMLTKKKTNAQVKGATEIQWDDPYMFDF
jgi:hypothetical protein